MEAAAAKVVVVVEAAKVFAEVVAVELEPVEVVGAMGVAAEAEVGVEMPAAAAAAALAAAAAAAAARAPRRRQRRWQRPLRGWRSRRSCAGGWDARGARALALYAGAGAARGAVASQQRCAEGEAGGEGGEDGEGCAAESAVERFARVLHMAYAHGREMQELEARAAGS